MQRCPFLDSVLRAEVGGGNGQVVQTVERILYAQNDEDAKRVISQAQLTLLSQLSLEEGGGPPPPQANGAP